MIFFPLARRQHIRSARVHFSAAVDAILLNQLHSSFTCKSHLIIGSCNKSLNHYCFWRKYSIIENMLPLRAYTELNHMVIKSLRKQTIIKQYFKCRIFCNKIPPPHTHPEKPRIMCELQANISVMSSSENVTKCQFTFLISAYLCILCNRLISAFHMFQEL